MVIYVKGRLQRHSLCMALPVVMLTLSLRSIASITTGYSEAHPLGEIIPKALVSGEKPRSGRQGFRQGCNEAKSSETPAAVENICSSPIGATVSH